MALCCRSGGCHENGRHEAPSDSIMESIMESLANSVAKMLLGEHIAQQASFSDAILLWTGGVVTPQSRISVGGGIFFGTVHIL